MKIICIDNFDRESVSDTLIAENVDEYWAPKIVEIMNRTFGGEDSPNYFISVEDDHKLYVYKP